MAPANLMSEAVKIINEMVVTESKDERYDLAKAFRDRLKAAEERSSELRLLEETI